MLLPHFGHGGGTSVKPIIGTSCPIVGPAHWNMNGGNLRSSLGAIITGVPGITDTLTRPKAAECKLLHPSESYTTPFGSFLSTGEWAYWISPPYRAGRVDGAAKPSHTHPWNSSQFFLDRSTASLWTDKAAASMTEGNHGRPLANSCVARLRPGLLPDPQ